MSHNKSIEFKPLFTTDDLNKRVQDLGATITEYFQGEPLVVISVLKGAFIFTADLIRAINLPLRIEFIGVSSYAGTVSTGQVRITHDLTAEITGKNVLLVEDIVDTGKTLDYLVDLLMLRGPKQVKVCALLSKPEVHKMRHTIDFTGFEISKEFVIGYGLDLDGMYRNLPYVAQVTKI